MSGSLTGVENALVSGAVRAAARRLMESQKPDGHWCGRVTAGAPLEADYILLELWMRPPVDGTWSPGPRVERAARALLERQLPCGGWNLYPGGPAEVSATVKAYCALKLAGIPAEDPRLGRARGRILDLGGVQAADSVVRIHLSLFGLYPREGCPSTPPVRRMSAWARAIWAPLAIVRAADPRRAVPAGFTLEELFRPHASPGCARPESFLAGWWERHGSQAIRRRALRAAWDRMVERFESSGGPDAVFPSLPYFLMALDVLGYPPQHELRRRALAQLESLLVEEGESFFVQPCLAPVQDTAMAVYALRESGECPAAPLACAAPEAGDAAMALLALAGEPQPRAVGRLLEMQSREGGWAACPDVTGQVLEALASQGVPSDHSAVRRAVRYLERAQRDDGSWYGRRGVAYLYGTCFALRGLAAAGESDREAHILRAGEWLRSIQNADGGWGESCASYENGCYTPALSTPSQTAWALLGLMAGGDTASRSVHQGVEYLLGGCHDGAWSEEATTGTGFPGVFYLNYHLYRQYFPLLALAGYVKHNRGDQPCAFRFP